jgi:hypothetical protein
MGIINRYGLINAKPEEDVSENCLLFTLENIILKESNDIPTLDLVVNCEDYIDLMYDPKTGMYDNIPGLKTGKDAKISHDQYTSLCSFSYRTGGNHHKLFWDRVKFGTYDNLTGKFNIKCVIHPRDYLFIGMLNNNPICIALFPLFHLITLQIALPSYKGDVPATDGELLTLVRFWAMDDICNRFFFKYMYLPLLRRFFKKDYEDIFKIYFPDENHPNRQLIFKQFNNI